MTEVADSCCLHTSLDRACCAVSFLWCLLTVVCLTVSVCLPVYLSCVCRCVLSSQVLHRLMMSRVHRPPIPVSRLVRFMKGKDGKVAVVVATVTDDVRMYALPAMTICALRFTESARSRIVKAGGQCLTFDQLALAAPTGSNCILLRGETHAREAQKHFGPPPGSKNSHTKSVLSLVRRCCCGVLLCV